MKVLTFYSDSHSEIFNNFFLNSFTQFLSNHQLIVKKIEQLSPTGEYESSGFDMTMIEKLNLIIENIDVESNQDFIYADCDVQFFSDLDYNLYDFDILFQNDFTEENYCAGLFIAKQNHGVLEFFKEVKEELIKTKDGIIHDQTVINRMISRGYHKIKIGMLPFNKYWTVAFSTNGNLWNGQQIKVPNEIIAHHANWTVGIKNKINLLKEAKKIKLKCTV